MSWWMLGAACNAVIALAYSMIVFTIARPLVKSRHVNHRLMPYAGVDLKQGLAKGGDEALGGTDDPGPRPNPVTS